jgi:uncharacterized membrane protein YqjE
MSESGPASATGAPPADAPSSATGSPGIRELLARLAASIASAAETRVQLAALEYAEERERLARRFALGVVAAVAGTLALLAANALVVVLLWDRLGWISLAVVTVFWLVVAVAAGMRMATATRRERRPFDATLAEFERDRAWIAERFGKGPR